MGNEIKSIHPKLEVSLNKINKDIRKFVRSDDTDFIGLLGGKVGLVLYFFYMGRYLNKSVYYKEGIELLSEIINQINDADEVDCKFSSGLSGLGWALCHIRKNFSDVIEINESILRDADASLLRFMYENLGQGDYDYLHNGLGPVLYFMNSNDRESVAPHLKNVAVLLVNMLEKVGKNKSVWRGYFDKREPTAINYGISHGFISILAILAKLYKQGFIGKEFITPIRNVCNFIVSHKQITKNSIFPYTSYSKHADSRLAWCYGDLGVGIALHHANQVLNDEIITQKVIEIFQHSARRRDLLENGVYDAGLCHGSSGIALIFLLMHRHYNIPEFEAASKYWLDKTFEFSIYPDAPGGFKAYLPSSEVKYENTYGFLEGVSGIALALTAFRQEITTDWAEILLLV